ncbi:MAG: SUMF1/EgtB/PvdO family nonheme iron enzyme [Deltaproteobacteria bacterium]|nr:SUMF1/EgtB/PvdO family nonheme iron enzyme [Deltaproteobacteria bacterium]
MGSVLFATLLLVLPPTTQHRWALVEVRGTGVKYWQALAEKSVFEPGAEQQRQAELLRRTLDVDRREANGAGCAAGMVRVAGKMQNAAETIARQNGACLDAGWNPKFLCTKFDAAKLAGPTQRQKALDYCIDRYEFPNIPGEYPGVLLSFTDGERICEAEGKHLCNEDEWTFACEGPAALPYPYGYARYLDPRSHFPDRIIAGEGCNIDVIRHRVNFDPRRMLRNRASPDAAVEIDKLWAGTKSGERAACVSPFRVYDITGNVEEWTSRSEANHRSVLKGGYWSPVESRCQPANTAHGPSHAYYQTGFRCCARAGNM